MINIAILSSHNGSGFDAIYEAITNNILDAHISMIISNNSNANVLKKAKEHKVSTHLVNKKTDENPNQKIYDLLIESKCDIVFLSGYMKKLPPEITNKFTILNSHPSLLPKYGGAGMYGRFIHEAVIENAETVSGVTIHTVNEIYDDGKIILQKSLTIEENETIQSLETKIKNLEKTTIIEAIKKFLE